jgi:hypothetical protein
MVFIFFVATVIAVVIGMEWLWNYRLGAAKKTFLIGIWLLIALGFGIGFGWEAGMGVILLVSFIASVWACVDLGVDAALDSMQPRFTPPEIMPADHPRPRDADPTGPDDEHPVIVLHRLPVSERHVHAILRRRARQGVPPLDRRAERRPTRPA